MRDASRKTTGKIDVRFEILRATNVLKSSRATSRVNVELKSNDEGE
jgi:hypothetical protein